MHIPDVQAAQTPTATLAADTDPYALDAADEAVAADEARIAAMDAEREADEAIVDAAEAQAEAIIDAAEARAELHIAQAQAEATWQPKTARRGATTTPTTNTTKTQATTRVENIEAVGPGGKLMSGICVVLSKSTAQRDPYALNAICDMRDVQIVNRNRERVLSLVREGAGLNWAVPEEGVITGQKRLDLALDIPYREAAKYIKTIDDDEGEKKKGGKKKGERKINVMPPNVLAQLVAEYGLCPSYEQIAARALLIVLTYGASRGWYTSTADLVAECERLCCAMIEAYDSVKWKWGLQSRGPRPRVLMSPWIIAMACMYTIPIARIDLTVTQRRGDGGSLAVWRRATGLWCCDADTQPDAATSIVEDLLLATSRTMTVNKSREEALKILKSTECTELLQPCVGDKYQQYMPVANGIVDISAPDPETGALPVYPYSPDWICTRASAYPYIPDAPCPAYTYRGDKVFRPDTWLDSISIDPSYVRPEDDPELATRRLTIRQMLAAAIHPSIPTSEAVCLFDTHGRTNKGTLCRALSSIAGPSSVFSTDLQTIGARDNKFALDGLGTKSLVLMEENDTNSLVSSATKIKNLATQEVLPVERKHRSTVMQRFHGVVVIALNAFPQLKDKSPSAKRRFVFRHFKNRISREEECRTIKDEWLTNDAPTLTYLTKIAVETARDWYASGTFGKWATTAEDEALSSRFELRNDDVAAYVYDMFSGGGPGIYIGVDGKTLSGQAERTTIPASPFSPTTTAPTTTLTGDRLCAITKEFLWQNFLAWKKDNGGSTDMSLKKSTFVERLRMRLQPDDWICRLTPDDMPGCRRVSVRIRKGTCALDVDRDGRACLLPAGKTMSACILDASTYGGGK